MCVALDWYAESPAQAQVCNLECHALVIHQQVLWLQVPVHHTMLVAVRQPLDELVEHALHHSATAGGLVMQINMGS